MYAFLLFAAACWLCHFAGFVLIQKPLFGFWNRGSLSAPVTAADIWRVWRRGAVSDAIVASYLAAVPLLAGALCTFAAWGKGFWLFLSLYNIAAALAMGLLVTADAALYRFWQFKIDASVFVYLRSLKGATASVSAAWLASAAGVWLGLSSLWFAGTEALCLLVRRAVPMPADGVTGWGYAVVAGLLLAGAALLFVLIRGTGIRPNNPTRVYFSNQPFLNHWALNPGYSIIYSLSTKEAFKGRFRFFSDAECQAIVDPLFPTAGTPQQRLLRTDRPNVLLVIWESLGSERTGSFGGRQGITPSLDALAAESVCFTRCTAGSFRTDRGLVCLLSGFPAQPTTSIIRYTRKLPNLPGLARTFAARGYATEAIHGGDLSTMHKNDYYLASGHRRLLSQSDYPASAPAGKWGIHDGYMMQRTADEVERLTAEGTPFFLTLQTLSSHEPFEVPGQLLADPVDNAFAYTDRSLGELVARLKGSPAWEQLLLIVVADHGLNLEGAPVDRPAYARIPMLWAGGAVAAPQRIDTLMSQTDLAATLLGQLGIGHEEFRFSRDVLADTYTQPFSLHVYTNGFMVTDAGGYTICDTLADRAVEGADPARERIGRAILQALYADLHKR